MTALSYDLAKQLEAAGWRQPGTDDPSEGYWVQDGSKDGADKVRSTVYSPSLSELIEAIPTRIDGKKATLIIYRDEDGCSGSIETEEKTPPDYPVKGTLENTVADFEGETLEEGLARLWLALKVKP